MQKIKIGDTVEVRKGAERTQKKRGKVLSFDWEKHRVRIEGVRSVKRHTRKGVNKDAQEGGILEKLGSVALSNVGVVCPKCDKPTRVGIKVEGDKKQRYCKKCEAVFS